MSDSVEEAPALLMPIASRRLVAASELLGIRTLHHLIIEHGRYVSLSTRCVPIAGHGRAAFDRRCGRRLTAWQQEGGTS